MRIHFDNVNFSSNSGPNSFGFRLAEELTKMGHEIVDYTKPYDIFLCFIEQTKEAYPIARKVLRLDGIWFKPEDFEERNIRIKQAYFSFGHVIFQSEFDKQMVQAHFGERSDCSVIHNGIRQERVKPWARENINKLCVSSANWHRQKRLKENILLFREIQKEHPDSVLVILGGGDIRDVEHMFGDGVIYAGQRSHADCLSIYSAADFFIHLAWLDHCPNVVVEALSQGCPVICSDSGGTKEIVQNNGIIVPEKTKYNYELLDYDSPYELDVSGFKLPEEKIEAHPEYLDIRSVAERYVEIFEKNV
jgi:glycosyltransferase involved in cell wall biosynthesis